MARSEHEEQVAVVQWCNANDMIAVSVPNGFHTNGKRDGRFFGMIKKLKSEGMRSGFPDLIILKKDCPVMFVEMKKEKGSTTSKAQKDWQEILFRMGNYSFIAKGADEAIREIKHYYSKYD